MGDGLFFWLIIVAIAVLQGIGQKKRKTGKPGQRLPGSKTPGQQASTRTRPRKTGPGLGEPDLTSDEGASSEAMIPSDVWEEILGLARGTPPGKAPPGAPSPAEENEEPLSLELGGAPPKEGEMRRSREVERRPAGGMESRRPRPSPDGSQPARVPAAREFPASHGARPALHTTQPADSEARLGVPRQVRESGSESRSDSVRTELFGGGTLRELRKAIVHQEVLGKPVALREDG